MYDDTLDVQVTVGGSVYDARLGASGGTVTIQHDGRPLRFELDCDKAEVICPSEVWPDSVVAEHRSEAFPHRVWITLRTQRCDGRMVAADPAQCGEGTANPSCDDVCDGELTVREVDRFGVINEDGDGFELHLGAGIATNGINCALLGNSIADADLQTTGSAEDDSWEATAMTDGRVQTSYAGGCLWAGDPDMDGELQALVLGATVKISTGFTGVKR